MKISISPSQRMYTNGLKWFTLKDCLENPEQIEKIWAGLVNNTAMQDIVKANKILDTEYPEWYDGKYKTLFK